MVPARNTAKMKLLSKDRLISPYRIQLIRLQDLAPTFFPDGFLCCCYLLLIITGKAHNQNKYIMHLFIESGDIIDTGNNA